MSASAWPNNATWNAALYGGPGITVGSDILNVAARIAGIVDGPGIGLATEEITEILAALNAMLNSWSTERLMIPAIARNVFDLVASQANYTVGPAGNFDTPWPQRIERAGWVDNSVSPATETPLDIYTEQEWALISPKAQTSTAPSAVFYDPQVPLGILYPWPIPTDARQIALYLRRTLSEYTTAADTFYFLPGYLIAIQYNLAIEIANRFPRRQQLSQKSIELAGKYKAAIKIMNYTVTEMSCESGILGVEGNRGSWDIEMNRWR